MQTNSDKKLHVHIGIISAFVCIMLGAFAYGLYSIYSIDDQTRIKQQEISRAQDEERAQFAYKDIVKNSAQDRERAGTYFLKKDQIVTYIEALENLALKAGVSIDTSVSADSVQNFDLKIAGPYTNILKFISLFESLPYYSTIQATSIYKSSEESTSTQMRWSANLKTHLVSYTN